MFLCLLACVSPFQNPVDPPILEILPDAGEGETPESLPEGDAREEELPSTKLTFDHARGLYYDPFTVTIATDLTEGELLYTLDGSDPAEHGVVYDGPVSVTTTTILRATVVVDDAPVVPTVTATYLFPAHVPDQEAPEDWPRQWWTDEIGGPWDADYEMDEEVTSSASWQAHAIFEELPILSVVVDPDELWDERRGMHENPMEVGELWERAASVELIDGDAGFTIDCGIRLHGGTSREPEKTPKKAFRLHFRGERGPETLEYKVFPDSDRTSFEKLVLRAGYNRSWGHFEHIGRKRADYVRERFGHEVYRGMGYEAPHVRHVHLFLDGLYWGLYQIEERPDADFLAAYVGGTPDSWDVLNMGEVMAGDDVAWRELLDLIHGDLSSPEAYAEVEARLDLERFADYVLLEYTLGNVDWPDRNWYAARPREEGGRWVFHTWDSEFIIPNSDYFWIYAEEDDPGEIMNSLRANEEFRILFADAIYRHLSPGAALSPEVLIPLFQSLADPIVPGIIAESARWGDHWRDVRGDITAEVYTYDTHWLGELDRITRVFFPPRNTYALATYRAEGLYPPMDPPVASPGAGAVEAGDTVTLTVPEGEVWYTTDGTDPRARGGDVADTARRYTAPFQLTTDTTVRTRVLTTAGWSALAEVAYTVN